MKKITLIFFASFICFGFQQKKVKTDSIAFYLAKKKPIKAMNYARVQSDFFLNTKKHNNYCDMMFERALLFEKFNDYENALKILFESRKIAEQQNLIDKLVIINWKTGNLYSSSFNFTKAKKYLYKAKALAEKTNRIDLLSKANQGLFRYYGMIESDSAEYFLHKVAYYTKNSTDIKERIKTHQNFFHYYMKKEKYSDAKKNIDNAIELALQQKEESIITHAKNNLGYYYLVAEKDYQKAKDCYIEILKTYPNDEDPINVSQAYMNVSFAYEKLGDYKNALDYTNKYLEVYDVIFNGKLEQATQEIETKYAIDKIENKFNEKEKLIVERQSRNQKLFLLLASLFILAGFIFYFYYQNLLLKQKNKLKDLDTNLQFKIISATLDGQDQERNKISGVLHDHVSAVLSSVGLHLSAFESNLTKDQIEDLKKTRTLLKNAHDKVRDLSHELVPPLLVKFGLQFALKDLCENNSNSLLNFEYNSKLKKDARFNPEFETKIFYIVSELLNNIIKHSNASKATLNLEEINSKLHITITDNGKGFNSSNISKSNGFGLTQIRARVKNMNGTIHIKSKENEGTKITIAVDI